MTFPELVLKISLKKEARFPEETPAFEVALPMSLPSCLNVFLPVANCLPTL